MLSDLTVYFYHLQQRSTQERRREAQRGRQAESNQKRKRKEDAYLARQISAEIGEKKERLQEQNSER